MPRWLKVLLAIAMLAGLVWLVSVPRTGVREIPVLLLHQIGDGHENYRYPEAELTWLLDYLERRQFHVLSLEQYLAILEGRQPSPLRPVLLTFDDGERTFLTEAWPRLRARHFSAVLFVNPDFVDRHIFHTVTNRSYSFQPSAEALDMSILSWDELKVLSQEGVSVQSHSLRHRPLAAMKPADVIQDLQAAKRAIEFHLGTTVQCVSYPWGESTPEIQSLVCRGGYRAAFACRPQQVIGFRSKNPYALKRYEISAFTSRKDIITILWGWMWLKDQVRLCWGRGDRALGYSLKQKDVGLP